MQTGRQESPHDSAWYSKSKVRKTTIESKAVANATSQTIPTLKQTRTGATSL